MSAAINLLPIDPAWNPQLPIDHQLVRAREAFDVATIHLNAVNFTIVPGMLETIVAAAQQAQHTPPVVAHIPPPDATPPMAPVPSASTQPSSTGNSSSSTQISTTPITPAPSTSAQPKRKKKQKGSAKSNHGSRSYDSPSVYMRQEEYDPHYAMMLEEYGVLDDDAFDYWPDYS